MFCCHYLFLDINELNLPKTCTTEFPDPDDLLNFKLIICPDEVNKLSIICFIKEMMSYSQAYLINLY